jgi:hypothetical protein
MNVAVIAARLEKGSSMANQRMTTAATSVEVGAIPRATFEPPPGYKQVPAP